MSVFFEQCLHPSIGAACSLITKFHEQGYPQILWVSEPKPMAA